GRRCETLYSAYVALAIGALLIAVVFWFAKVPAIKMKDESHLDDSGFTDVRSIWSHPHFVLAVAAQFFYVAAQAGIFSFFINYMTSEVPAVPASWNSATTKQWFETGKNGLLSISDQGAATLASLGFVCFLIGRFT